MWTLFSDYQGDTIDVFYYKMGYFDYLLHIYDNHFLSQPNKLQINRVKFSETKQTFLATKIYDKRGDFDFKFVYFPFLMVITHALHLAIYSSQLLWFSRSRSCNQSALFSDDQVVGYLPIFLWCALLYVLSVCCWKQHRLGFIHDNL